MATTVVTTAQELADALGPGNEYDYIYLGAHIQIPPSGMTIDPNKTTLDIDGMHESNFYSLEEPDDTTETGTIGIREASNITVTLKNMVIVGKNPYGLPYVSETADTSGVTVVYENVIYSGPQITFNPNGAAYYRECDIIITYPDDPERVEGVGVVNRAAFDGTNVLSHSGTNTAMFQFRGAIGTASFTVCEGAELSADTDGCFMVCTLPDNRQNPVRYLLEPNARFSLTADHGISCSSAHPASSFVIDTGATFRYIQAAENVGAASLYINGGFTVNKDADVYMQADYVGTQPLLSFVGRGGALNISRPKSLVLYSNAGPVITVGDGAVTKAFSIAGGQLNLWTEAEPLPDAGGIDDRPDAKWNRPTYKNFTIEGYITQSATAVQYSTFTPEELAELPDFEELSFQSAKVLSVGNLPLEIELMSDDGYPVNGNTDPLTDVVLEYTVGENPYTFENVSGLSGNYAFFTGQTIPAGTIAAVTAYKPFLITSGTDTVKSVADTLYIIGSTNHIRFNMPPILTEPDLLLGRENPQDQVEVMDTRAVKTRWELLVSIAGPLQTERGEVLHNAVVFRDTDGTVTELSDTPLVVYEGEPDDVHEETFVFWPAENGILVRVTEPIHAGTAYTTDLKWEVREI